METDLLNKLVENTIILANKTTELCNDVLRAIHEQEMVMMKFYKKSEERIGKISEAFVGQEHSLRALTRETQAQRAEYDKYIDSLKFDRDQIREEYKKLVEKCLKVSQEKDECIDRTQELLKLLIAQIGHGTTINTH